MQTAPGDRSQTVVTGSADVLDLVRAEESEHASHATVAVLLPCHDEATTIGAVVSGFRRALPDADIYVYDNASADGTADIARAAGAIVRREPRRGKGNVVRRMFAEVEADVYVLADGDDTYDADAAPQLVDALCTNRLDMVVGTRHDDDADAYRRGHRFGNQTLTRTVAVLFGRDLEDMLSGYRVLSRRFVKSFPADSSGFEIESEMTIHALELRLPVDEIPTRYRPRVEGSQSKLRTLPDGLRILGTILLLCKEFRPLKFFGSLCALFAATALLLMVPVVSGFVETGSVARLPTVVLAAALGVLAGIFLICGLVLDSLSRSRRETKRMMYLALGGAASPARHLAVDSAAG